MRPAFWRFSGVPFWAPGVFGILLGPSEAFSWDARRQGSSCVSLVLFFFFPFCFAAILGGGYGRPLFGILSASFVASGARDPRTPSVQGLFVRGGGLLCAPSQALFTLHVLFPPQGFFFSRSNGGTNSKSCYEYSPEPSEGYSHETVRKLAATRDKTQENIDTLRKQLAEAEEEAQAEHLRIKNALSEPPPPELRLPKEALDNAAVGLTT